MAETESEAEFTTRRPYSIFLKIRRCLVKCKIYNKNNNNNRWKSQKYRPRSVCQNGRWDGEIIKIPCKKNKYGEFEGIHDNNIYISCFHTELISTKIGQLVKACEKHLYIHDFVRPSVSFCLLFLISNKPCKPSTLCLASSVKRNTKGKHLLFSII